VRRDLRPSCSNIYTIEEDLASLLFADKMRAQSREMEHMFRTDVRVQHLRGFRDEFNIAEGVNEGVKIEETILLPQMKILKKYKEQRMG
jgi:hypothetical protein